LAPRPWDVGAARGHRRRGGGDAGCRLVRAVGSSVIRREQWTASGEENDHRRNEAGSGGEFSFGGRESVVVCLEFLPETFLQLSDVAFELVQLF